MTAKVQLIGFEICPFTQRSHILLHEKKVAFEMTYLPRDKPEWFIKLSPFGQVPTLCINNTALFESLAINEYIDEAFTPHFLPKDVLERAKHRGISIFSNSVLNAVFAYIGVDNTSEAEAKKLALGSVVLFL